jgi:hypothetical protein
MKLFGTTGVGFDVTDQLLTTNQIFFTRQILEKRWEYNETIYQLFTGFKSL